MEAAIATMKQLLMRLGGKTKEKNETSFNFFEMSPFVLFVIIYFIAIKLNLLNSAMSGLSRTSKRNSPKGRKKLLLLVSMVNPTHSWQQWNYSSFATDDWKDIFGFAEGPRGREGHSMVVWNETKVVMFGGRDNEVHRPHVPKTYNMVEEEGVFGFETYDGKPLLSGYDPACLPEKTCVALTNATSGNNESCSYSWQHAIDDTTASQRQQKEESCGFATTGQFYNDIWVYDLDCHRFADLPCQDDGWRVLHPGIPYGGCRDKDGLRTCETPSERWEHVAAMIDSSTMVVYGGYSQECEDYCDDVWSFDFDTMHWERIFLGADPGKRWKASMVSINRDTEMSSVVLFGGHRLWHGFASQNSQENRWENTEIYPDGGYLNDLWILEKRVDNDSDKSAHKWTWTQQVPQESCVDSPGIAWEDRNNVRCEVYWPRQRSGHASAFDSERNRMWIHGGYTAHYPYPSSSSSGSGDGVKSLREIGFIPFASHSYYLDDLWVYDIATGVWEQMRPSK